MKKFENEALSVASLSHANIVNVFDVGSEEVDGKSLHYIVMELIEGSTLRDAIQRQGKFSNSAIAKISKQIASALECAHEHNIIHRDIKPANILITKAGDVKVTDFGIARISTTATITYTSSILGTVHYISPEQAKGHFIDQKSDIYSLGVVMYEMATGQVPFDADNSVGIAIKHIQDEPAAPIEKNPSLDKGLNQIILKCMKKDPANRYLSTRELLRDLNNYKDANHYGEWINSWILVQMKNENGRLTEDNYKDYLEEFRHHYINFDYNSLFDQTDNEADYYISGLLNKEITGANPVSMDSQFLEKIEMKNANIIFNQYEGTDGLECHGTMARDNGSDSVESAMLNGDYCGIKFNIDVSNYRALTFYGKKVADHGCPTVCVYDENGKLLREVAVNHSNIDTEWHQYAVNLDGIYGDVIIIMNGGCIDNSGSSNSNYLFSKIVLY